MNLFNKKNKEKVIVIYGDPEKRKENINNITYNINIDNNNICKNEDIIDTISNSNIIKEPTKQELKQQMKKSVGKKFVVGNIYMLKQKSVCGSQEIIKKYVCKKFIYTSKNTPLNVLILKQIEGPIGKIFTLNKNGCKKYHIKYEPGLQVFSMELNWIPCKY